MKIQNIHTHIKIGLVVLLFAFLNPIDMQAQRFNRSGGSASTANRSVPSRSSTASRPKTTTTRPTTSHQKSSINGGFNKSTTRNLPKTTTSSPSRLPSKTSNSGIKSKTTNKSTNKTSNIKNKSGNKVNIDNSNKNININVDNSKNIKMNNQRNTMVRGSNMHYNRPPYHYGGRAYYCHAPYHYHPYHPAYWGPAYHPWGFFVATIATTAIIVSIENQKYHYDNGVYYTSGNGGYTVVQAPVGATVTTIPSEAEVVKVNETTNNYYYGGAYYEKDAQGYTVVPATAGTIVPSLPEGGEETKIGDQTYVQFGDTYYQPIQVDGKNMYEIVEVKDEN